MVFRLTRARVHLDDVARREARVGVRSRSSNAMRSCPGPSASSALRKWTKSGGKPDPLVQSVADLPVLLADESVDPVAMVSRIPRVPSVDPPSTTTYRCRMVGSGRSRWSAQWSVLDSATPCSRDGRGSHASDDHQ